MVNEASIAQQISEFFDLATAENDFYFGTGRDALVLLATTYPDMIDIHCVRNRNGPPDIILSDPKRPDKKITILRDEIDDAAYQDLCKRAKDAPSPEAQGGGHIAGSSPAAQEHPHERGS